MKIALVLENSQKSKSNFIYHLLKSTCEKYHHEVFNYGVSKEKDLDLDYVKTGVLTGILLDTKAADFVITGCNSGQGALISANQMPNVSCGYVTDLTDISLFLKINAKNAISIPFGKKFGPGYEYELQAIFKSICTLEKGLGYPKERKEIQHDQLKELAHIMKITKNSLYDVLDAMDKDFLYSIIANPYFEENFFANCQDDKIASLLKDLIDNWL